MTRLTACLLILVLASVGCTVRTAVVRPPGNADSAFSCMTTALNGAGYVILDYDRNGGSIRAEKEVSTLGVLTVRQMAVLINTDEDGRPRLQVTPSRWGLDGLPRQHSGGDNDEAAELAAQCGETIGGLV